jgi:hypothetical protein
MGLSFVMLLVVAFLVSGCGTMAGDAKKTVELRPEMSLKAGEEVYACNCGAACKCDTLSRNPGQCTCGKDMVKAKVLSVGKGEARLMVSGEERTFKTVGKYACACGLQCPCNTISQNAGKCTCGVEMQAVN